MENIPWMVFVSSRRGASPVHVGVIKTVGSLRLRFTFLHPCAHVCGFFRDDSSKDVCAWDSRRCIFPPSFFVRTFFNARCQDNRCFLIFPHSRDLHVNPSVNHRVVSPIIDIERRPYSPTTRKKIILNRTKVEEVDRQIIVF